MSRIRLAVTAAVLVTALAAVGSPAVAFPKPDPNAVTVLGAPEALAFSADGESVFVVRLQDDAVDRIAVDTIEIDGSVTVGDEPTDLALSPDGSQLWVTNFAADTVSVVDVATFTVIDTVDVGDRPFRIEFGVDGEVVFVSHYTGGAQGDGGVTIIDAVTHEVDDFIETQEYAQMLAPTPDGAELWVGVSQNNALDVIDLATGEVVDSVAVAWPWDWGFSPGGSTLYVATGVIDGVVEVIDVASRTIVDTYADLPGGYIQSLEISPDGTTLFVAMEEDVVHLLDAADGSLVDSIEVGNWPHAIAISPDGLVIAVASYQPDVRFFGTIVDRERGSTRYETAVEISERSYPSGSNAVFVATGADYPDALAAGPAAASVDAPLLLTPRTSLPGVVAAEIDRLDPDMIVIVGGTGAVSGTVAAQLGALAPSVMRISGSDRYATARAIVQEFFPSATTAYVATGRNFPDALSASAAGAATGVPVLLIDGAKNSVDAQTLAVLAGLGVTQVKIAGGTGVVRPAVETQLGALYTVDRLSGATRYGTSLAIGQDVFATAGHVLLATGSNFPDALAGAPLAGVVEGPLFLTTGACIPADIRAEIADIEAGRVTLLGGTGVLSPALEALPAC